MVHNVALSNHIFNKRKTIKNILYLSYTCEIANLLSFALWSEKQILGIPYFIIMIGGAIILNMANRVKIKKIA